MRLSRRPLLLAAFLTVFVLHALPGATAADASQIEPPAAAAMQAGAEPAPGAVANLLSLPGTAGSTVGSVLIVAGIALLGSGSALWGFVHFKRQSMGLN